MASVVLHGRSLRGRSRQRRANDDDVIKVDYHIDPAVNLKEILTQLTCSNVSKTRRLGHYNAACRLLYRTRSNCDLQLTTEELIACLKPGLLNDAKEIRTACLRTLRYCCQSWEDVQAMLNLHVDFLIVRSLDIRLDNEVERVHAMRLIRKIISLRPEKFPRSLLHPMISIANNGSKERDKLVRTCLATICELALYNAQLVAECGGISTILDNVLYCHQLPRINESLMATILHLLNHPETRRFVWSCVDLEQMLAPFTDFDFKFSLETSEHAGEDGAEFKYDACKMALASIMKSWPGIFRLCRPDGTGLQSLIGMLYLPNMETRKEIMDVFFDVFRLSTPEWTDNYNQALCSIDPSEMIDSWKLVEGFVMEEGKSLLPHRSKTRPDLVVTHAAVLLAIFIRAGLLEALVETIVTSEQRVSIRATILLGELLHLSGLILPDETSRYHHCLPSLIDCATKLDSHQRKEAISAVNALSRFYAAKRRGSVPCSLFLDHLVRCVDRHNFQLLSSRASSSGAPLCQHCIALAHTGKGKEKDKDVMLSHAIRDSQVLYTKDNQSWNWDLVSIILSCKDESLRQLQDQTSQRFIRRILYLFKPTNRIFSVIELSANNHRKMVLAGLHLIDFLLNCDTEEAHKFIREFLDDILLCLLEVRDSRSRNVSTSGNASKETSILWTPSSLSYTASQFYFSFIGHLSSTEKGSHMLDDTRIYQTLITLISTILHDTYVKLIVSSLDYGREGSTRLILSKALKATSESARLYTTSFMRVLMRLGVAGFSRWGIESLVSQLYDSSTPVAMEALSILSETCDDPNYLMALIQLKPSVLHLGPKGELLLVRFLSTEFGFHTLSETGYVETELEKWNTHYNVKYVKIVEERLNEALTTYEKTYDGSYVRRSHRRVPRKDVFLPVHLYGMLVKHAEGCELLSSRPYIADLFATLHCAQLDTDTQILKVKAALWATGHIGQSSLGVGLLQQYAVIPDIIRLAEDCGVFSIRGTAFYVLGLIASTQRGADILHIFGWEAVRRSRETETRHSSTMLNFCSHDNIVRSFRGQTSDTDLWSQSEWRSTRPHSAIIVDSDLCSNSPSPASGRHGASFFVMSINDESSSGRGGEAGSGGGRSRLSSGTGGVAGSSSESNPICLSGDSALTPCGGGGLSSSSSSQAGGAISSLQLPSVSEDSAVVTGVGVNDNREDEYGSVENGQPAINNGGSAISINCDAGHQSKFENGLMAGNNRQNESSFGASGSLDRRSRVQFNLREQFSEDEEQEKENTPTTRLQTSSVFSTPAVFSPEDTVKSDRNINFRNADRRSLQSSGAFSIDAGSPSKSNVAADEVHPTDFARIGANLKRVPSLARTQMASATSEQNMQPLLTKIGGWNEKRSALYVSNHLEPKLFMSSEDLQGYTEWQGLRPLHYMAHGVNEEFSTGTGLSSDRTDLRRQLLTTKEKTKSLDFRASKARSSIRNLVPRFSSFRDSKSTCSCPGGPIDEIDLTARRSSDHIRVTSSKTVSQPSVISPGSAEFIGVCIPIDISMIFEVNDKKDDRLLTDEYDDVDLRISNEMSKWKISGKKRKSNLTLRSKGKGCASSEATDSDNILSSNEPDVHNVDMCISCCRPARRGCRADEQKTDLVVDKTKTSTDKSRVSCWCVEYNNTSSDQAGGTGFESGDVAEITPKGRALVRKEIHRLVVNLASSVGVKSSEQALLVLKQKFPAAFQDLCLYSEISHLLANYNYRISCRRFIQELFQDLDLEQCLVDPKDILGVDDTLPYNRRSGTGQETDPFESELEVTLNF